MTPTDLVDVAREAIWVLLAVASPVMLVALGVGLIVALVQALTQVQEMTLAFVPKILAIFLSLIIFIKSSKVLSILNSNWNSFRVQIFLCLFY